MRRIVHVSILNAQRGAALGFPYYVGKAEVERTLRETGLPHSILSPCVIFGGPDILINNIAWMLRWLPVFGVFGDGQYRLRAIHVDDMSALAVDRASRDGNEVVDAVGPESFTFRELAAMLMQVMGVRRPIVSVPPWLGLATAGALNPFLRDVIITREEIDSLMAGLLDSPAPAAGPIRLSDWAREHRHELGRRYASDLGRRVRRDAAYESI